MQKVRFLPILGASLLIVFFLQLAIGFSWDWLDGKQNQQMFRRWSGLGLGVFILFQWALSVVRIFKFSQNVLVKMKSVHNILGALSPILFFIHSTEMGFGYLLVLSTLFFVNMFIGIFNTDVLKKNDGILFQSWMISHVGISLAITVLMIFHIGMVFYYK